MWILIIFYSLLMYCLLPPMRFLIHIHASQHAPARVHIKRAKVLFFFDMSKKIAVFYEKIRFFRIYLCIS